MVLIFEFGIVTLGISTGVNRMGKSFSFGFYTLRDGFRVYLGIMRTNCSILCPCLLPMVYIGSSNFRYFRYSMMPFATFLIPFSVEFSIMGYVYGNNLTVTAIISAHFFTA